MTTLRASAVTAAILRVTPLALALALALVSGCGGEQTPQTPPRPAAAETPTPPPAAVALPEDFPSDLPPLDGLTPREVKPQGEAAYQVEYEGDVADRAALRERYAQGLEERGWNVGISATVGQQESILATKGRRTLSFMAEPGDAGARVELSVDREDMS